MKEMKEQLLIKVLEMLVSSESGAKIEPCSNAAPVHSLDNIHVGEYVLIRTYSAGVHFGRLIQRQGKEALLDEARRIWDWEGAFTLSKVATSGIGNGKLSTRVDGFIATEVIEVLPLSGKSKENLYGISDHEQ